uniref:Uncharacterized protein n=1 Tax=Steinernema glaseri TaxID=37863 RepID=A0A1I7YQI5_9BILA
MTLFDLPLKYLQLTLPNSLGNGHMDTQMTTIDCHPDDDLPSGKPAQKKKSTPHTAAPFSHAEGRIRGVLLGGIPIGGIRRAIR